MKKYQLLLVTFISICIGLMLYFEKADKPIRIVTHVYPPHQIINADGILDGYTVSIIKCIMQNIGYPYNMQYVKGGWPEMQHMMETDEGDIFFAGIHSEQRDHSAIWSHPIGIQKIIRIMSRNNKIDLIKNVGIYGGKKGSGITRQMEFFGVKVSKEYPDDGAVIKAVLSMDIDYAYIDINTFLYHVKNEGVPLESFTITYIMTENFGAYITKVFLSIRPKFMQTFNDAADQCYRPE